MDRLIYLEGQVGLEPTTFCLRGRHSNQLSYWPVYKSDCTLLPLLVQYTINILYNNSSF